MAPDKNSDFALSSKTSKLVFLTGLTLGNSWGKLCVMSSSKPDYLPKMPLSLKKIKPAIMANSMISIYSKL